ncbi:hypothetical protein PLICRDRAFT_178436 [Plicaturopsis crispa FD-325 SS-3]|nr:hypothetical protein PLICRDRAFT_178436 [Plicaturopsis crispa FD-325 SS-3]
MVLKDCGAKDTFMELPFDKRVTILMLLADAHATDELGERNVLGPDYRLVGFRKLKSRPHCKPTGDLHIDELCPEDDSIVCASLRFWGCEWALWDDDIPLVWIGGLSLDELPFPPQADIDALLLSAGDTGGPLDVPTLCREAREAHNDDEEI